MTCFRLPLSRISLYEYVRQYHLAYNSVDRSHAYARFGTLTQQRRSYASPTGKQHDTDIIVVGSGLAGISAALSAAEKGASVLVLDRAYGGGASALSGGIVYAGGGTKQQEAAGISYDTQRNFLAYMREETTGAGQIDHPGGTGGTAPVDDATLERFCTQAPANLAWLEKHGAEFEVAGPALCPFKTSYPPDHYGLYYSGNETSWPWSNLAKPAPRGHRPAGKGLTGKNLWEAIFHSALSNGVRFLPACKVEKLLKRDNGSVFGVAYRQLDAESPRSGKYKALVEKGNSLAFFPQLGRWYYRRAEGIFGSEAKSGKAYGKAVVLAAGGFSMNDDMTKKHIPDFSKASPLGTIGDDGSGITLGVEVGGSVSHMDRFSAWRMLYPPTAFIHGIVVSQHGQRFASEDLYGAKFSEAMIQQAGGKGFLILDAAQFAQAKSQLQTQPSLMKIQRQYMMYWMRKKAGSLESLAQKINVPAGKLVDTISRYNEAIAVGEDDPFNKSNDYRSPIVQGPFYAMEVSTNLRGLMIANGITLGGLRVDGHTGEVLDSNDKTITGLYAAGRNAVGICSNGYVSGLSLADCVFSGRRAGEHAAALTSG